MPSSNNLADMSSRKDFSKGLGSQSCGGLVNSLRKTIGKIRVRSYNEI